MKAWLQFFRLPNLPTAPGDALAGAAVVLLLRGGSLNAALAAGGAALFLYMYGLADNDIVGAASDAERAPERPIPRGAISLRAAKIARSACLFAALLVGAAAHLPPAWWIGAAALTAAICVYNRVKSLWLMGLCRGLSVLCGTMAVLPPGFSVRGCPAELLMSAALVLGWTLYIAAVTKLSEGEESDSPGLSAGRYLLGLAAFTPLLAYLPYFLFAYPAGDPRGTGPLLFPALGCLWAYARWCAAVAPLGEPHGPAQRRPAVGRAIGALLYLQLGFLLLAPDRTFLFVAAALWFSSRLIRRFAPSISGS